MKPVIARFFAKRRIWQLAPAVVGLALLAGLVAWYGFADVAGAFVAAGWGIVWVTLLHLAPLVCDTLGWRRLFRAKDRPPAARLFLFRWIGESVNNLLPAGQVGGDVVRARLAAKAGAPTAESGAATVVDFTLGLITLLMVSLAALGLLTARTGLNGWIGWILLSLAVLGALIAALVVAQVSGLFGRMGTIASRGIRRITAHPLRRLPEEANRIDATIGEIYRRYNSVVICALWRLAAWMLESAEIQLAMYFLGTPIGFDEALILHALTKALRSVAFVIPAGLGVQDGGFVLIGDLLGIDGPTAVALALIRRVRELLLGLPGLTAWWLVETRAAARRTA